MWWFSQPTFCISAFRGFLVTNKVLTNKMMHTLFAALLEVCLQVKFLEEALFGQRVPVFIASAYLIRTSINLASYYKMSGFRGFSGGSAVKTLHFHYHGQRFNPW